MQEFVQASDNSEDALQVSCSQILGDSHQNIIVKYGYKQNSRMCIINRRDNRQEF